MSTIPLPAPECLTRFATCDAALTALAIKVLELALPLAEAAKPLLEQSGRDVHPLVALLQRAQGLGADFARFEFEGVR